MPSMPRETPYRPGTCKSSTCYLELCWAYVSTVAMATRNGEVDLSAANVWKLSLAIVAVLRDP